MSATQPGSRLKGTSHFFQEPIMSDHIFIYLIVAFNAFCQLLLIRRQKLAHTIKWRVCCFAGAFPIVIMVLMRLLIVTGLIHGNVAEQTLAEHSLTKVASILLIAGPWLVTLAVILTKMKEKLRVLISQSPPAKSLEKVEDYTGYRNEQLPEVGQSGPNQ